MLLFLLMPCIIQSKCNRRSWFLDARALCWFNFITLRCDYLFLSRSRISPSSFSSLLGSGAGAGSSSFFLVILLIALITKKILRAIIRGVSTNVAHLVGHVDEMCEGLLERQSDHFLALLLGARWQAQCLDGLLHGVEDERLRVAHGAVEVEDEKHFMDDGNC